MAADEIKTRCLLEWGGLKVCTKGDNGTFWLQKDSAFFELTPLMLAQVLDALNWITAIPYVPVRPDKLRGHKALAADFSGVPFETYIITDNLYQGYLQTQRNEILNDLAQVLYDRRFKLKEWERIAVFYWVASLKNYLSHKYPDLFKPAGELSGSNMLGSSTPGVEESMNAQIRALTKGDVTKEEAVLSLETHRALTELNAQAKEYKEFNAKYPSK